MAVDLTQKKDAAFEIDGPRGWQRPVRVSLNPGSGRVDTHRSLIDD
jgi:hypothetical protein